MIEEILDWVRDYMFRLSYSIRGGVVDYGEMVRNCARWSIAQTSRSRPNAICDLIGLRAAEAFADIPHEVRVEREYETTQLRFLRQGTILKFNQVDANFRIHPPSTARALSFVNNAPFLPFAEMGLPLDELALFGGYRVNEIGTELLSATVTCQHRDQVIWKNDIPEPPAGHQFSVNKPIMPQSGPAIRDRNEDQRKIESA